MLRANMELEESMEESAEDIAAAETAPRPIKETHFEKKERYLLFTKLR